MYLPLYLEPTICKLFLIISRAMHLFSMALDSRADIGNAAHDNKKQHIAFISMATHDKKKCIMLLVNVLYQVLATGYFYL